MLFSEWHSMSLERTPVPTTWRLLYVSIHFTAQNMQRGGLLRILVFYVNSFLHKKMHLWMADVSCGHLPVQSTNRSDVLPLYRIVIERNNEKYSNKEVTLHCTQLYGTIYIHIYPQKNYMGQNVLFYLRGLATKVKLWLATFLRGRLDKQ